MIASFRWFLGENDLKLGLYDEETKGCCDGLESYGINRNQGLKVHSVFTSHISWFTGPLLIALRIQNSE
ncbi:hypothetical protein KUH03_34465 [Sphingobacterium sp. E70]|nr:hypothetical protein KUH03_34465 [Sphingobacterium sp. E70]